MAALEAEKFLAVQEDALIDAEMGGPKEAMVSAWD
jgi:hypothetical protein